MADVTPFNPAATGWMPPQMPRELEIQVETLRRGGSRYASLDPAEPGLYIRPPPPEFHPGAPGALALIEAWCGPARLDIVAAWLGRFGIGLANTPAGKLMAVYVEMLAETCHDLPAGVFGQETLIEARRAFKFWPSIAELYKLLKPYGDRITGTRDALRRIVAAGDRKPAPTPQKPPEVDEAAVRHVRAVVAAFERERSFHSPGGSDPEARRVTPQLLSDGALLAAYEKLAAENAPGAQTRVSMLRRKLGERGGRD